MLTLFLIYTDFFWISDIIKVYKYVENVILGSVKIEEIMKDKRNIIFMILGIFILAGLAFFYQQEEKSSFLEKLDDSSVQDSLDKDYKEDEMKAYITGEVENPGVYCFNEGDRLEDLVIFAGGFTNYADPDEMNLALLLEDEMMIKIPSIDELESRKEDSSIINSSEKINLNLATKEELMTLPGIGEKKAEAIISFREEISFKKTDELLNVPGIGPGIFKNIEELIEIK